MILLFGMGFGTAMLYIVVALIRAELGHGGRGHWGPNGHRRDDSTAAAWYEREDPREGPRIGSLPGAGLMRAVGAAAVCALLLAALLAAITVVRWI